MNKIDFKSNREPSLGIELELALVDEQTMALSSSIIEVLDRVPERFRERVKPELMQSYLEINTDVCRTIGQAEEDLREKVSAVEQVVDELGLRLYWSATHPFSLWQEQQVSPNDRYQRLLDMLQDIGRQLVTFGLHVHVGVDSGDKAVMICDRIQRHLPTLLALSCNSPWWNNRITGLQSHRSKIMETLPTAGLPPLMRNWSEYAWLVNHLVETGFINSIRDIWWDVRPHHNFGTVEVRMCDMPGNLSDSLALAAIVQCLVVALAEKIDEGTYQHDHHPMMIRQNKWRAGRFGLDAPLVDCDDFTVRTSRQEALRLIEMLRPYGRRLDCEAYLEQAAALASGPSWAQRQLDALRRAGSPAALVRQMTETSRIS
ncbi:MAG: YbdK family carboxylate-amine ligase [Pirellulales bacterium]